MALTNLSQITTSGISTLTDINLNNITGVAATFTGNVTVGGTLTYDDVTNIDSVGLITARSGIRVLIGTATTALVVEGDARITGILTVGSSSLTLDGTNNVVNVGTALTLGHTQGLQFHTQNLHSQGFEVNNVNATGIVTATTFSIADKIVHTGDTNTAIRFPADDTFTVETSGSERVRVTSDGKIGIGASAPAKTLEVKGDVRIYNATDTNSAILDITADSTGSNGVNLTSTYFGSGGFGPIRFTTSDTERLRITSDGYIKLSGRNVTGAANGNKLLRIYQPSRTDSEQDVLLLQSYNQETVNEIIIGGGDSSYNATTDISFRTAAINTTSGTERLRITSDGKVGIGLTNPGALLHLESTAANAARLRIGFDSPRYYDIYRGSTTNSGYLNFYGSQSTFVGYTFGGVDGEWMRIKSNGRVGIGTNNPSELLHLESGWTKQILKSTNLNTASSLIFDTHNINTADYLLGQLAGRWNGNDVAYINFEAGADTTNKDDGVITFLTSASGSSPTERVRITSDGHMTMGVPNYSFNNAKGFDTYLGMAFNQYDGGILMTSSSGLYAGEWSFGLEASASHTHFVILDDANERVRITSDGKVGIGDDNPLFDLHINSDSNTTLGVYSEQTTGDNYQVASMKLRTYESSSNTESVGDFLLTGKNTVTFGGANRFIMRGQTNVELAFYSNNTERMTIDATGNVGIDTDIPTAKLHINGGAANYTPNSSGSTLFQLSGGASSQYSMYIGIDNDGGYLGHNGADRKLFFQTNESTRMTIDATGKVGIGVDPTDVLHVQTSNTTGSFRLGGNNSGHRIFINSHPTGSYLDSYGSNAYQLFRIDCSTLSLNGGSGGGVNINRTGTAYAQLDLRQSTGHPAFNIGFPDGSFYRNLGTVGPNDSAGNSSSSGGQYLHIRLRTVWNDASMTMFRLTGFYAYSAYAESYLGMYRYGHPIYRTNPYGQFISNQGNRTTVHSIYNTTADPGYLVIVCDWGTNYTGLMIEHNGAGADYGSNMQYDVEIIDTKRSTSTSAQW
jgi:hypothetical protein